MEPLRHWNIDTFGREAMTTVRVERMTSSWEAWDVLGDPGAVVHARHAVEDQGELFSA